MKNKNIVYRILILFVLISVVTNTACLFIRNSVITQEKLKAEYTVKSTIDRVEMKLETYIEKVQFLKKTIESGIELNDAYFQSIASRLYGDDPAIKTIELAPNGVIQNVYPLKENKEVIGMDMLAEHERKEAATLAKDTRKYTLEGPYDLKQGGKGALLYDPIYVNGEFWGFSILVIDWDAFLTEIHLDELEKASYDFVIWKKDRVTKEKIIISKSSENIGSDTLLVKCALPNNNWNFEIIPKNGWINKYEMMSLVVASIMIDFLVTAAIAQLEIRHKKDLEYATQIEMEAKKAQEASAAKSRFLFSMSHDIRTPMNAIVGMTTLLQKDCGNEEKVKEYAKKIELSSKHLLGIINDVLDMNKIESGKTTLNYTDFSILEFVEQINTIFRPQMDEKQQSFEIHVENISHEWVHADSVRLMQIFNNLLSNAVKYTQAGGHIQLWLEELSSKSSVYAKYRFLVVDNGMGMEESFKDKIFDAFTREENSVTNRIQGTGLGMAITKNLLDAMGGTIEVESEKGKGSCFEILLDLKIVKDHEAVSTKIENSMESISGMKFLCAEDNELNAEILEELLKYEGAKCVICENGKKIVETFEQSKPGEYDMILMDIQMPIMNGYEATLKIRSFDQNIPIIAMTANAFSEDIQHSLSVGMDAHISKPVDMQILKSVVQNIKSGGGGVPQKDITENK